MKKKTIPKVRYMNGTKYKLVRTKGEYIIYKKVRRRK